MTSCGEKQKEQTVKIKRVKSELLREEMEEGKKNCSISCWLVGWLVGWLVVGVLSQLLGIISGQHKLMIKSDVFW